jgi:NAD+ kinase
VAEVVQVAQTHGLQIVTSSAETDKHPVLKANARDLGDDWYDGAMQCTFVVVLAGDGTLLRVLNMLRDGPPVLGVNFGILGYLSGIGHDRISYAIERLIAGEYRVVDLPVLEARTGRTRVTALNDIVASGGVTGRIVEVGWGIAHSPLGAAEWIEDDMGVVPCDGMVIATPVGSTAYNLSNGGPVMSWGVHGYCVSFIAPHTLTARPLVVSSGDRVRIRHMGRGPALPILADGDRVGFLEPSEVLDVYYADSTARLAMVDADSFYERYHRNFATQIQRFDQRRVREVLGSDDGLSQGLSQ